MDPRKKGISHILFEKRWNVFVSAILIGIIGVITWPISIAFGRNAGLGITTPTSNLLQYLLTGDIYYINWGVFLVLGILIGSYVSAKLSGEFKLRIPDVKTVVRSALGGSLMGIGAVLAGGWPIGNGLVQTSIFTWQGWIALVTIILGTWFASHFIYKINN